MANQPLTIPEKSALLVLMLMGKEVANSEIKDAYRFVIDKPVREALVGRGLIDIRQETKPRKHFVHVLTEAGWRHGRRELVEPLPNRADKAFRVLHGVLRAVDAYLTRTQEELRPFLHAHDDADRSEADVTEWIESAYDSLVGRPGGWVSLTRLRGALARIPRDEMDDALRTLSRRPQVYLIPEANQKILTSEDRAAAVELGGEAKHLLSIERQ
ncbi:MAG TPA: hypothetical protein VFW65_03275 [Pseudonocardiaceae bacterium]|nr:hypothetical protein [Pseudonocardiaceae bacterium]